MKAAEQTLARREQTRHCVQREGEDREPFTSNNLALNLLTLTFIK